MQSLHPVRRVAELGVVDVALLCAHREMRRMKRVAVIVGSVVLLAVVVLFSYGATAPNVDDLKRMGDPVVSQLQEYRTQHGHFPASLEEARIKPPRNRYGHFYAPDPTGDGFQLTLGDYERYDIMIIRLPGATTWTVLGE